MDLFSPEEIAAMSGGVRPAPPRDYVLPTEFPAISRARRIALDFETYDPDISEKGPGWRRDAYPVGISVAAEWKDGNTFAEYYPVKHRGAPNLEAANVFGWLQDELAFFSGDIVGANLLYEADGLQTCGVVAAVAKWRDVQWAEALLDENAFSYKLNTLAAKHLNEHKATDELKQLYGPDYITRFAEVHPGHARTYGLGDVLLPLRILDAQLKELHKEKMDDLFDLECRLLPFLIYMRKLGVRVDLEAAKQLGIAFLAKRDAALKECSRLSGIEMNPDNFNKPTVLGIALERVGVKNIPRTPKTNQVSVKDAWLENKLREYGDRAAEFGENLAAANKYEKAYGTFVDGYVTNFQINGRVHCEFHPLRKVDDESEKSNGTVSGRFSGTHPNLQNIPARDEEIGPLCRGLFIADEGAQWWSQDYSQIEYRYLVHYAVELKCEGAEKPQQMYQKNPGTDFHEMCAELVWAIEWLENKRKYESGEITKKEYEKECKRLRKPAKNLNFGMVYGMGEDKLGRSLGETELDQWGIERANAKAKAIMAKYHEGAPFIRDLNNKCSNEAQKLGYITTILGRRSRFNLWEPKFTPKNEKGQRQYSEALPFEEARAKYGDRLKRSMTHKALNRRLQGSAADLMKVAMVQLWEAGIFNPGNDITCVLTVHDELNGSVVPSKRGLEALAEVKRIMESAMTLHVPILTSGSTGANWSEAK